MPTRAQKEMAVTGANRMSIVDEKHGINTSSLGDAVLSQRLPGQSFRARSTGKWPRYRVMIGFVVLALLLSGCKSKTAKPSASPAEVATVTIRPEPAVLTTELPGRTSSYLVAEVRPQVSGLLQKRVFREGSSVKAGDLLYQIDPAPYQAAYEQAKAALATAEADLITAKATLPAIRLRAERLKGLAAIHAVGQQDYDDASAALEQAEATIESRKAAVGMSRAAVESARINLSYTPIKAPISGRIGISSITVGAMTTAYQPTALAVIQQLDPIYELSPSLPLRPHLSSRQVARLEPLCSEVERRTVSASRIWICCLRLVIRYLWRSTMPWPMVGSQRRVTTWKTSDCIWNQKSALNTTLKTLLEKVPPSKKCLSRCLLLRPRIRLSCSTERQERGRN